jgi:O-antigen/teichoic acid export membrane protein
VTWSASSPGASEADAATRGSGVKLAAELAGRALSLAASFALAAGLGVDAFGIFAAASGVAVILAEAADLGLQGMAVRALVSRFSGLRAMLRAKAALTAAVTAAAVAFLGAESFWPGLPRAVAPGLLVPLVFYYVLAGWSELLGVALRAHGRRGEEAAVVLVLRAGTLAAVLLALRGGTSLAAMAWAHVAATLPAVGLSWLLARRAYHEEDVSRPQPAPRVLLRSAAPLAVNGGLALLGLRLELLAVYFVRGDAAAGLFGAALKVIESLNGIPSAVAAGALPSLTRDALQALGAVRERVAATMALLAVPAAAGLALSAGAVIVLLGADYAPAAAPLQVLALSLVPLFMNTVLVNALVAAGHAPRLPWLTALRVGVAAVCAVLLIRPFGTIGAAAGFLASETAMLLLAARACARVSFPVPVSAPLLRAAALTVPMVGVVALAGRGLVPTVALGAATYAATLFAVWRTKPELVPFLPAPAARGLAE